MTKLAPEFMTIPLAHRALHDVSKGCPENSMAAIQAAIDAGYGIEIDVQLSSDGQAMVFHDYDLARLTADSGPIRQRSAADLGQVVLTGGTGTIPTLAAVLALVAGQVPVLVEIKDQDGVMGANVGILERAVAKDMQGYDGPLAVMSFNPHSVQQLAIHAPDVPRGLVTCSYDKADWPLLPAGTRDRLGRIPDYDAVGASFISHNCSDLDNLRVADLKQRGVPILCWTVKSEHVEKDARRIVDNITFEGYLPRFGS